MNKIVKIVAYGCFYCSLVLFVLFLFIIFIPFPIIMFIFGSFFIVWLGLGVCFNEVESQSFSNMYKFHILRIQNKIEAKKLKRNVVAAHET